MKKVYLSLVVLPFIISPALAEPFTYAPKDCEFQTTFPEKPFIETKCITQADCTEIVTFTKAVGAASSTNFRVTCNPAPAADIEKYTPAILEETLKKMTKTAGLEPYDTRSSAEKGYKQASTLSLSERDGKPLIYNGQIWVGKSSIFTVEAEMLGEKNDVVQKTFADILRNTFPKDQPSKPLADKPKSTPSKETVKKEEKPAQPK